MASLSSGYYLIDADYNIVGMNETAISIYPQLEIGKKSYKTLMGIDEPCGPCPVFRGIRGPRTYVDPIRQIAETVDAVEVPMQDGSVGHALVFSTVGTNAQFAATLPKSSVELKNLALIKALAIDFYDVFSVNLADGATTIYRHAGKSVDDEMDHPVLYEEALATYVYKYIHPEDQARILREASIAYIRESLREKESMILHYRVLLNNELHYYFRKIVRIGEADAFDHIVVGIGCEDVEVENRAIREELEENLNQVKLDSTTGLLTKEAFIVQGGALLEEHRELDYDFCILKLENIMLLAHQFGDMAVKKVLHLIGQLLQDYEDEFNSIAYMGDGIFASITVNTGEEDRKHNISKFKNDIIQQSELKNLSLKWSIYKQIRRDISISEVYENTNFALSIVRASVKEDYIEFNQSVIEKMELETKIENNFEHALETGELVAWYQPKHSVRTGEVIGAEALVRWIEPDGNMIYPNIFIPVLEKNGKINQLDAYIFEQVCMLQKKLKAQGIDNFPISVNLSRASMFTENIAENYAQIAKNYGVDVKYIPIEITESAAVRATSIRSFAKELISRDFVLHMDDFGSGYSSLASLQIIPFECIKIDKSLIDFIGMNDGENLLKHVIAFAKESGKYVVAEGVENYEQFLFLKVIGCDAIQGYYYSRPENEAKFLDRLDLQYR